MNTSQAAQGRWLEIFSHYGLTPSRKHSKEPCPFCYKKNSFRISAEKINDGLWICTCGSGNGFQLISQITEKPFADVARDIDQIIGRSRKPEPTKPRILTALDRWPKLSALKGTDAEQYLNARGIFNIPRRGCKFGYEMVEGKRRGCMYSIAVNRAGDACYVHQTFLDGDKKATFHSAPVRKLTTLKKTEDSIAIRLDFADTALGIAEGIESALSAQQRFKVPTYAAMNTAFMRRFMAPEQVETLFIFADSDKNGAGLAAAHQCAHNNMLRAGKNLKRVIIRWPKLGDFNDNMSGDLFEWILER